MLRGQVGESLYQLQMNSGVLEKISSFEDWKGVCEF